MNHYLQQILDNPLGALAIVGNLVIIESLLSVDNAAVLATMVGDLPPEQRKKALRYGISGPTCSGASASCSPRSSSISGI